MKKLLKKKFFRFFYFLCLIRKIVILGGRIENLYFYLIINLLCNMNYSINIEYKLL